MASKIGVVLQRENVLAATPEMGKAAAAEEESWDGSKSPTDLQLFNLLQSLNAGDKPLPLPPFVHKAYVYSDPPEVLVKDCLLAPGTGHGREGSCYFYSKPAPVKEGEADPHGRRRHLAPGGWRQTHSRRRWGIPCFE